MRVMAYGLWMLLFLLIAIFWFDPAFIAAILLLCIAIADCALVWYLKLTKREIKLFGKKIRYGK